MPTSIVPMGIIPSFCVRTADRLAVPPLELRLWLPYDHPLTVEWLALLLETHAEDPL